MLHNHTSPCGGQDRSDCALSGQMIEPLELPKGQHVDDLIEKVFGRSGFNARRLYEGAELYRRMIDDGATIALTLAGAMTPIGMGGVIISLIESGFVDVIISTGANLYHDLHRAYGAPMHQGSFQVDDNELEEKGIARIHDVFISSDDTLIATDRVILEALANFDGTQPFSTARLHRYLGEAVAASAPAPEKSLLAVAARCAVPVYTSSPGDSSIGMNLILPYLCGRPVNLNPLLDVIELTALVREAELNGVVIVGGGSPKNFYLQTQATLTQILSDTRHGGHDYVLQLTTDFPHWGGLSGATLAEAKSWGKVKDARINNVVVYSCASLTLPLLAHYVLGRCKPRRPRRLLAHVEESAKRLEALIPANVRELLGGKAASHAP